MDKVKSLVIVGDSMSMPRFSDKIPFEETYPALLHETFKDDLYIINRSRRANTTAKQLIPLNVHDDIDCFKPDFIIIHIGMADCAPRIFSELQQKLLERMPDGIRNIIIKKASKNRKWLTKNFPKVYVKPDAFAAKYEQLLRICKKHTENIICIGIAPAGKQIAERSFGFEQNIKKYNEIIAKACESCCVTFINVHDKLSPERDLLSDGFHANKYGAQIFHDELMPVISRMLNDESCRRIV